MVNERPPQQVFTVVLEMATTKKKPPLIKRFTVAAPDETTALNKAFIHAQQSTSAKIIDHRIAIQPGVYW